VMGLTGGKYGTGHTVRYMKAKGPKEVFAHVFSAIMQEDQEYLEAFPNTVALVKKEFNL
jgi:hypothetical protein